MRIEPLILLILISTFLASCIDEAELKAELNKKYKLEKEKASMSIELDNEAEYYNQHYKEYTLVGCENSAVGDGNLQCGSHKGNCKNPIHKK